MRKRKQRVLPIPATAKIEKLSHDGRGIARIDGKATFIESALTHELVSFEYIRQKRDFDEGRLLSIIEASESRVEPKCPHYSVCGGCSLQHLDGAAQIAEKQSWLIENLERNGGIKPDLILSPLVGDLWNYRSKARLSVRYVMKKEKTLIGFREKVNPRYITEIECCPVLHKRVDNEIANLRVLIDSFDEPMSIAQIEVAAGDEDVALIFRNMSPLSRHDEDKLKEFGKSADFRIFLQPGGVDTVSLLYPDDGNNFITYSLPNYNIKMQFHPTDFTQVNLSLNRLMVIQALKLLDLSENDVVLDLFCGLGNFSLPMAKNCKKVIGIEGSEEMVMRAQMNANSNGLNNTEFFAANLDNKDSLINYADYGINKILLDPPRTGALEIIKQIGLIKPEVIVYVSCNQATFARDADLLVNTHGYKMETVGVMDMFPHTSHSESIALFTRS